MTITEKTVWEGVLTDENVEEIEKRLRNMLDDGQFRYEVHYPDRAKARLESEDVEEFEVQVHRQDVTRVSRSGQPCTGMILWVNNYPWDFYEDQGEDIPLFRFFANQIIISDIDGAVADGKYTLTLSRK